MQDRFKFRAKRCDDNRFVYGYLVFIYIDNHKKARIYCPDDTFSYDVYTDTLGQCTGLKDKNGRLIYEGDIVRQISKREPEYEEYITEVKWCAFGYPLYDEESFDFEVIGNIHENGDLLNED
jgi:uncharacterized phage protein (TIGR01671 family)